MEGKNIKCHGCKKKLKGIDIDWYMMTGNKLCTDCDGKDLDKQKDRLDKLYEELAEQ